MNPTELAKAWNEKQPIGTPVTRYKLINPFRDPSPTKTTSEAWVVGGHTALIKVEGANGGVLLDSIVPAVV